MFELLKTKPDETSFKQLLPFYNRNAEHTWDNQTGKGYTLLDIACLYEYDWVVDTLIETGVTHDLYRLNATKTSKAIKDKLKDAVQSQQHGTCKTSGSGSIR